MWSIPELVQEIARNLESDGLLALARVNKRIRRYCLTIPTHMLNSSDLLLTCGQWDYTYLLKPLHFHGLYRSANYSDGSYFKKWYVMGKALREIYHREYRHYQGFLYRECRYFDGVTGIILYSYEKIWDDTPIYHTFSRSTIEYRNCTKFRRWKEKCRGFDRGETGLMTYTLYTGDEGLRKRKWRVSPVERRLYPTPTNLSLMGNVIRPPDCIKYPF